ncbi:hypothetical protein COW06_02990 [Candidatus Gracilibacteria bacterium CG12_big_fil_rev_8_21_14_0_65_38_15]|nr:MAG: hypothetical protein COW06_02990 [Candidatus Gracilibacteria bacterium CG12_big_fil_rev_8_21_14_0_65_38_15]PIZ01280.1 MAG: hypothetical protein COY60_04345 [Candidatus Gracilibacteria bacterium CG_4_10_14_0_8_um_filter_38_28]
MKALSFWKKSFYSAIIFFGTFFILSVGYGALFGGLTAADRVGTGSGLTATAWNRIVDGVLDINTRLENLSFSGGNVGIGENPTAKFSIKSSNTNDATTKAQLQQYSALTIKPHNTNSVNMNIGQVNNGDAVGIQVTNYNATADWDIALNPFGGSVGIGTTNPGAKLEVIGDIFINGNNVPYKKLASCNGANYTQIPAYYPTTLNAAWVIPCSNACASMGAGFAGKVINYVSQTIGTGIPQVCGGATFYPTHNPGETTNGQAVAQCVCMGW